MSRFARFSFLAKFSAANAIAAAGLASAAVALSPIAAADPVLPPVMPDVPALGMIQQLASNPAGIGAVLQSAATALSGASSIVGAPAGSTLPVSPIAVPGAAPVAPVAASTNPIAEYLPLLNQIGIPGNLVNLAPSQMPFPIQIGNTAGVSPAAVTNPVIMPAVGAVAPIAPAPPVGGVLNPLPLLAALP
jgi:hypothetical protein